MKYLYNITVVALLVLIAVLISVKNKPDQTKPLGALVGEAYANSTSTQIGWDSINNPSRFRLLKSGYGTLGNILVTGATTATQLNFYDATTTVNGGVYGTSTIAVINLSTPAGTYLVHKSFSRGLIVEFPTALGAASSTITFD